MTDPNTLSNPTIEPTAYGNIRNISVTVAFFMTQSVGVVNPIQVEFRSGQDWLNQMRSPLINGLYQFYDKDSDVIFVNPSEIVLVGLVVSFGGGDEL